jgi:hypothetical protein
MGREAEAGIDRAAPVGQAMRADTFGIATGEKAVPVARGDTARRLRPKQFDLLAMQ